MQKGWGLRMKGKITGLIWFRVDRSAMPAWTNPNGSIPKSAMIFVTRKAARDFGSGGTPVKLIRDNEASDWEVE